MNPVVLFSQQAYITDTQNKQARNTSAPDNNYRPETLKENYK
jgi:hypothetical protein